MFYLERGIIPGGETPLEGNPGSLEVGKNGFESGVRKKSARLLSDRGRLIVI